MDTWGSVWRRPSEEPCRMPLRIILVMDGREGHIPTNSHPHLVKAACRGGHTPPCWAALPLAKQAPAEGCCRRHSAAQLWLKSEKGWQHSAWGTYGGCYKEPSSVLLQSFVLAWFLPWNNEFRKVRDSFLIFVSTVHSAVPDSWEPFRSHMPNEWRN